MHSSCLPSTSGRAPASSRHALCGSHAGQAHVPARPFPSSHPLFHPLPRDRRGSCCAYTSSGQASTAGSTGQRARRKEDLVDPAGIGATGRSSTKLQDMGGEVSLTNYMTLPVEQYFVLDPKQIRHLGMNRFMLHVPRVNLFNIWLEPEVEIVAISSTSPPRVVLQAENCRIKGSELIENWRLDQRFCLRFVTELTWSSRQGSEPGPREGEIHGNAKLEVFSEVIPPFNLMPRSALEASCNVVMAGLVNTLLPLFLRKLGDDYTKWAKEPEYRRLRAMRSMPLNSLDEVEQQQ